MKHKEGLPHRNEADAELIKLCFQGGKLDIDSIRSSLIRVDAAQVLGVEILKPHPHYAETVRDQQGRPEVADHFMQLSDTEAVTAYNDLVDKFNADLERIKRENDLEAVKKFVQEAIEIAKK